MLGYMSGNRPGGRVITFRNEKGKTATRGRSLVAIGGESRDSVYL